MGQFGYYVCYMMQQYEAKDEMSARILSSADNSSLIKIVAEENIHQITWEEKDKEFYLNDELYDVIKIKKERGKTVLYCLSDNKEKELKKKIQEVSDFSTAQQSAAKANKYLSEFQFSPFLLPGTINSHVCFEPGKFPFLLARHFSKVDPDIVSPPPRFY